MRFQRTLPLVAVLVVGGGVFAACSDSTGSSGTIPDLTGTWGLVNLNVAGTNVPGAQGDFIFTANTVDIDLIVPTGATTADTVVGTGTYALTASNITINSNNVLIGQASGAYRFVDKPTGTADTVYADMISQGTQISVIVARP